MSFFIHKITIFHTNDDATFTNIYYNNVYFRHNKKTNVIDKGLQEGSTGTIIIPTKELLQITTNDYVVEGIVESNFDLGSLKKNIQVYKIVSVDDNRKGNLQHYKIGVRE